MVQCTCSLIIHVHVQVYYTYSTCVQSLHCGTMPGRVLSLVEWPSWLLPPLPQVNTLTSPDCHQSCGQACAISASILYIVMYTSYRWPLWHPIHYLLIHGVSPNWIILINNRQWFQNHVFCLQCTFTSGLYLVPLISLVCLKPTIALLILPDMTLCSLKQPDKATALVNCNNHTHSEGVSTAATWGAVGGHVIGLSIPSPTVSAVKYWR